MNLLYEGYNHVGICHFSVFFFPAERLGLGGISIARSFCSYLCFFLLFLAECTSISLRDRGFIPINWYFG